MNQAMEIELFTQFIAKHRVASPKRRNKIFADLRDTRYFDDAKCKEVASPQDIIDFLRSKAKTKRLYLICSSKDYDGQEVTLDALDNDAFWLAEEILGYDPALKRGFFVNHEGWYYVLG